MTNWEFFVVCYLPRRVRCFNDFIPIMRRCLIQIFRCRSVNTTLHLSNGASLRRSSSSRPSPTTSDTNILSSHAYNFHHYTTLTIIKDSKGYGMKVSGDNPVYVQSVKDGNDLHIFNLASIEIGLSDFVLNFMKSFDPCWLGCSLAINLSLNVFSPKRGQNFCTVFLNSKFNGLKQCWRTNFDYEVLIFLS